MWTSGLCYVDQRIMLCGPAGYVTWTSRLCYVDQLFVLCGPVGYVMWTKRHVMMPSWSCYVSQPVVWRALAITMLCELASHVKWISYTCSMLANKSCFVG